MAITLTTGATVSVAKTYATAVTMSAISNATEAVVTLDALHGLLAGDYIEVTSGWGLLDQRVIRVKSVNVNDVTLEGVDTSDTSHYPIGTGAGKVRKITAWSMLSQVKSISASGGSQNFANITAITDVVERQMPTTRSAVNMTVDVFDDPRLPWYGDVVAADEARKPYGMLLSFPNGSKTLGNAYWSLMRIPTMATNEALMTQISLSYAAEPIRYTS